MADENDIPWACNAITVPGGTLDNVLGVTMQRVLARRPVHAGGNNRPIVRPVELEDWRFVARTASPADIPDAGEAAGTCDADFVEADGSGAGSVAGGPFVPGNSDVAVGHNEQGGFESEYVGEGDTLSWSVSV